MIGGRILVIGLGPGPDHWVTPEARQALSIATDIIGYGAYVARVPMRDGLTVHASDNRVERERARHALELAKAGRVVAVVSGGDPGIFAMAAAMFEVIEHGDATDRGLDVEILPGVSAMQAVSARLGAPLGHDFCAISLSDNLKPWSIIEKRLIAASEGDFVIALYNPASKARPDAIFDAFGILHRTKSPDTPVAFARAVGRPDERIVLTSLAAADPSIADMSTLVMIGSSETRLVERSEGKQPWMYTPRSYGRKP